MEIKAIENKTLEDTEEIVEVDIANDASNKRVEGTKVKKGQVLQRNYILNDSSALKKKKRNETRKEAYNLGTEARDGSNMVIQVKTSFFE